MSAIEFPIGPVKGQEHIHTDSEGNISTWVCENATGPIWAVKGANYVKIDGSVAMTGQLSIIPAAPTANDHVTRKDYVDNNVATVSNTVTDNRALIDTNIADIATNTTDIAAINEVLPNVGAEGNMFDNPAFQIVQRGTSMIVTDDTTMDRWHLKANDNATEASMPAAATKSTSDGIPFVQIGSGNTDIIGNINFLQKFEKDKLIPGKVYTMKFLVYIENNTLGDNAHVILSMRADNTNIQNGTKVTVIPSIGVDEVNKWLTIEADFTAIDCTEYLCLGISFKDMDLNPIRQYQEIMRVSSCQLYHGTPPPFFIPNIAVERHKCEYFYYAPYQDPLSNEGAYLRQDVTAGILYKDQINFPVKMRIPPIMTVTGNHGDNFTYDGFDSITSRSGLLRATAIASLPGSTIAATFTANAEF